jgi:hypothetical protein
MKAQAWDVFLNGKLIDTVFFDEDMGKDAVYQSLVNHDGYHTAIVVRKAKRFG